MTPADQLATDAFVLTTAIGNYCASGAADPVAVAALFPLAQTVYTDAVVIATADSLTIPPPPQPVTSQYGSST